MIVETEGSVAESALVGDGRGDLHVFFVHRLPDDRGVSIEHTTWDGVNWSPAVDVIVESSAAHPQAVLDVRGIVHLIWLGSLQELRYASAPISAAHSAQAWSVPHALGTAIGEAGIAIDSDGILYVAYPDHQTRNTVLLVRSVDGGKTWSSPTIVAQVSQQDVAPNGVQIAVDGQGRLHATWTEWELPDGWPSVGTFYARSTDGGATWSAPRQMAEGHYGQIGVGTAGTDEVHVVWRSGVGGAGTFHQWSADAGLTWAAPHRYDDRGGFSGLPSFVEDAAGHLHYVLGAVKYAHWDGRTLSPYQDVAAERRQVQTRSVERGVIGITGGNRIHIVFEFDFESLWHTSMLLDIDPLPTATPDTQLTTPTRPPTLPAPSPTPGIVEGQNVSSTSPTEPRSPGESLLINPLVLSIGPAALLILAVAVIQLWKRGVRL